MSAPTNGHRFTPDELASETIAIALSPDTSEPTTLESPYEEQDERAATRRRPLRADRGNDDVRHLEQEVRRARGLVALQDDQALQQALSSRERAADRKVTEKLRALERGEKLKAGKNVARVAQRNRSDEEWAGRARRSRERLLNPNRRLAAVYRRYVALRLGPAFVLFAGVVWNSDRVHDGLVGPDGTALAYLVEPLASVLLIVSLFAQATAVEHGQKVRRSFVLFDVGFLIASLLLMVVPWGLRFGWSAGDLLANTIPSVLIAGAVVGWHVLNRLFSDVFADLHDELSPTRLDEVTTDVVVLYERSKREIAAGRIPVNDIGRPSTEAIRKAFGIGKGRAQLTGDAFDAVSRSLPPTTS
ncbi:hypothetical protein [Pseudonocardia sp. WMMC193]|uniref:hypothetical protein n=1 Tax=Pseudonocardia sp. WMMC193 TaxID=2911965 RepID=UPI001F23F9D0|nr:hypothetical protein [Pseudonocardia sp. WMMC193]MCF7547198.1 hypothetical protein [Pseudonocardia sp. WMMC193]